MQRVVFFLSLWSNKDTTINLVPAPPIFIEENHACESLGHVTNRFHVAACVYYDNAPMMSKCGKKEVCLVIASKATDVLTAVAQFDILCKLSESTSH